MQKRKRNNHSFSFFKKPTLKNFRRRITKILSPTVLLLMGLSLIVFGGAGQFHNLSPLSFHGTVTPAIKIASYSYAPASIQIPSASISLPISETNIENGYWQISPDGVSHLATSGYIGVNGNIILYGHNTNERLGYLHKVNVGDIIFLKSENGKSFTYVVYSIQTVEPTALNKLSEYKGQTLTIYTCTGFADLKRLLVKAERQDLVSLK